MPTISGQTLTRCRLTSNRNPAITGDITIVPTGIAAPRAMKAANPNTAQARNQPNPSISVRGSLQDWYFAPMVTPQSLHTRWNSNN